MRKICAVILIWVNFTKFDYLSRFVKMSKKTEIDKTITEKYDKIKISN
jgi:hypothetical protein